MQKGVRSLVAVVVAAIAVLVAAPVASARDDSVTSFDGTRIVLSFFPAEGLQPGQQRSHDPDRPRLEQRTGHEPGQRIERGHRHDRRRACSAAPATTS